MEPGGPDRATGARRTFMLTTLRACPLLGRLAEAQRLCDRAVESFLHGSSSSHPIFFVTNNDRPMCHRGVFGYVGQSSPGI